MLTYACCIFKVQQLEQFSSYIYHQEYSVSCAYSSQQLLLLRLLVLLQHMMRLQLSFKHDVDICLLHIQGPAVGTVQFIHLSQTYGVAAAPVVLEPGPELSLQSVRFIDLSQATSVRLLQHMLQYRLPLPKSLSSMCYNACCLYKVEQVE